MPNRFCCALGALRKCAYFLFPVLPHCGGMSLCALSAPRDGLIRPLHGSRTKQRASIHHISLTYLLLFFSSPSRKGLHIARSTKPSCARGRSRGPIELERLMAQGRLHSNCWKRAGACTRWRTAVITCVLELTFFLLKVSHHHQDESRT